MPEGEVMKAWRSIPEEKQVAFLENIGVGLADEAWKRRGLIMKAVQGYLLIEALKYAGRHAP